MECPNCRFVVDASSSVEGGCPNCGAHLRPERDQPPGATTDFQTFGMPAPGEDDGNNGNPLAEGVITGKDGERNFKNRDNYMGSRQKIYPPLWHSASEIEPDLEVPADLVDVIKEDDLPEKRKDRKLDQIEKKANPGLLALGAGLLARPVVGALMRGALGTGLKGQLGTLVGQHAVMNGTQGLLDKFKKPQAPAAAPAAPAMNQVRDPSFYSAINDSPGSNSHIPSDDTSNPEEVDPKENNDGEKKPLNVENDVNGVGGTDQGDFSDDTTSKLLENLPHLLDWAVKPESGSADPILSQLHNLLEGEQPGYLDDADDDKAHHAIMVIVNGGHQEPDKDDSGTDSQEGYDPLSKEALLQPGLDSPGNTVFNQNDVAATQQPQQGRCPQCGGTLDPSTGTCAQCGAPNQSTLGQPLAKTAGQGPQDDQQKAAVAQYLLENNRADEIPNMLTSPDDYADELAQVIGKDAPPEMDEQDQQAQPQMPPMSPEQGMPSAPSPGMGGQMMAAVNKYSDDHLQQHGDNFDNHVGVDAADVVHQEDPEQEQDSSHTWVDDQGQPLKVGQEYEMYSKQYDIPDVVRIEQVRPDSISYTLTGEYGLEHQTEITQEEANIEGLSFTSVGSAHPDEIPGDDLEENMDDKARPAPGEVTDLSTPHQLMSSTEREWLKEGGAEFTPHQQREFIEEAGVARNADKLDLSGTHYESSRNEVDDDYFLFGL